MPNSRSSASARPIPPDQDASPSLRWLTGFTVLAASILMTWVFWQPLWEGFGAQPGKIPGFIGGDMYPYFYPQKTFLRDRLRAGEFPLWNNLVGQGYPVIAESQTGVLYPPDLALYGELDVQTAYNAAHLVHAVIAFIGTWLLARRLGLGVGGALFTALVFVYGWFPARVCVEWAMIGGAYFPLVLWAAESWLQQRRIRWLVLTSVVLAMFLLAGHFHLAFITLLATVGYVLIRPRRVDPEGPGGNEAGPLKEPAGTDDAAPSRWWRDRFLLGGAIAAGFLLAAVQLVPTLELRSRSQRFEFSSEHDPLYGRIPPKYLSHLVAPWLWFQPGINPDNFLGGSNRVEAHLYCGLLPIGLALLAGLILLVRRQWTPVGAWLVLGLVFLALATGTPLLWLKALPGFGFFRGAGRYGMVTAFGIALASGWMLETMVSRRSRFLEFAVIALGLSVTTYDLLWVVPHVSYATIVSSPLPLRSRSRVREMLKAVPNARVFGPGQNILTIAGVSQLPVYLGIGPAEYFESEAATISSQPDPGLSDEQIAKRVDWLKEQGVTHVLGQKRWDTSRWPLKLVWEGIDDLFNPAWGEYREPLFLYELVDAPGRLSLAEGATGSVAMMDYRANRIAIKCALKTPGRVLLRDLLYPGWVVTVDGRVATVDQDAAPFRGVTLDEGPHSIVWTYQPKSLWIGGAISLSTLIAIVLAAALCGRKGVRKSGPAGPVTSSA